MDPRPAAVERRLGEVRRILAVTGGKGGIGKSAVASTLALLFAERGLATGLCDLDLTSPTAHVFLGASGAFPTEEFGIEPPLVAGVRFMSVSFFLGPGRPAPLRGPDVTNATLEILAVTRWSPLDLLVIDMPPGSGDAALDLVRLVRRAEYVVVSADSLVVLETARRTVRLLRDLEAGVAGVVENFTRTPSTRVRDLSSEFEVPFLGSLPWDEAFEAAVGDPDRLLRTRFAEALRPVRDALLSLPSADSR
jgi:ATP-binding protein involved in chromosome partitioning